MENLISLVLLERPLSPDMTAVIQHGDVIKDGQTFGASESERMKVQHAISREYAGLPVLRVTAPAGAGGA